MEHVRRIFCLINASGVGVGGILMWHSIALPVIDERIIEKNATEKNVAGLSMVSQNA